MSPSRSEELEAMPPSAKLVYKVLEWNGRLTQTRIAEETMLSKRTVRYALDRLEEADVVEEGFYVPDARKNLYSLREREEESLTA